MIVKNLAKEPKDMFIDINEEISNKDYSKSFKDHGEERIEVE